MVAFIAPFYSALIAALMSVQPQQAPPDAPATREITVNVQFDTFDDGPIPPLPLYLGQRIDVAETNVLAFAITSETGKATLNVEKAPLGLDALFLALHQSVTEQNLYTPAEGGEYRKRIQSVRMKYYLPELTERGSALKIELQPDQKIYDVILHAEPAVHFTGAVASGGRPVYDARVHARRGNFRPTTDQNGRFKLYGVPMGQANELFATRFPFVSWFQLDEHRTLQNDALEPIELRQVSRNAEFHIALEEFETWNRTRVLAGKLPLVPGVTLVSTDAESMLWFLSQVGKIVELGAEAPKAPPGEYYIAPGTFYADDIQLGLLDAIRAGVDLTDSGIPMIEIKEGEPASLVIDAGEVASAIERVMKQMEDDSDE